MRNAAGFIALLFLLCAGSVASQAAEFPEMVTRTMQGAASSIQKVTGGAVERILFGFMLKRSYDNFIALHGLTAAYIAETDDLVRAMHRPIGRVGAVSFEGMSGELLIDSGGGVRLLYGEDENGLAVDAAIDLSGFKEYVEEYLLLSASRADRSSAGGSALFRGRNLRGSVGLFLFDRRKQTSALLFGSPDTVRTISPPKYISGRTSVGLSIRGLLLSMPLDRADGDITLVALYPYRLLRGAVYTFGLIAIIILTILLLWLIINYMTSYCRTRGVQVMQEKDTRHDIINEIDKELTGGEKKKHPVKTEKVENSGTEKDTRKQLEEDGIYIGK